MYSKGVGNGLEPVNSEMEFRRIRPAQKSISNALRNAIVHSSICLDSSMQLTAES